MSATRLIEATDRTRLIDLLNQRFAGELPLEALTLGADPTLGGPGVNFGNTGTYSTISPRFSTGSLSLAHNARQTDGVDEWNLNDTSVSAVRLNISRASGFTVAYAPAATAAAANATFWSTFCVVSWAVNGPGMFMNAVGAQYTTYGTQRNGLLRWTWGQSNAAESTANAGSDWSLNAFADDGTTVIGSPIAIVRATMVTTFAGELITVASSTTRAGFNLPHGAAPTSPVNGDVWTTTGGFFVRINGSTKTVTTS